MAEEDVKPEPIEENNVEEEENVSKKPRLEEATDRDGEEKRFVYWRRVEPR